MDKYTSVTQSQFNLVELLNLKYKKKEMRGV